VKTISLRKKVAAVAVASLGFGLLSVVPANAASSSPTVGTASQSGVVGTTYTSTIGATMLATDTAIGTVSLTKPTGSSVTINDRDGSFSAATVAVTTSAETGFAVSSGGAVTIDAVTSNTAFAGTVTIIPDVPGTYVVTWTVDGPASATATFNISGAAGTVGTGGLGTTAITATAGGEAAFTYTNPSADASGTVIHLLHLVLAQLLSQPEKELTELQITTQFLQMVVLQIGQQALSGQLVMLHLQPQQ